MCVGELSSDERWPELGAAARRLEVESVLAVPIDRIGESAGTRAGVINIYAHNTHAFTDDDLRVAELFTSAAAAVIQDVHERKALRELSDQLAQALDSRAVIDQAKGILIATHRCTADQAFEMLVRLSQNRNVKLQLIARSIVAEYGTRGI
jgi:AmiR/NasT family two-component response regulator